MLKLHLIPIPKMGPGFLIQVLALQRAEHPFIVHLHRAWGANFYGCFLWEFCWRHEPIWGLVCFTKMRSNSDGLELIQHESKQFVEVCWLRSFLPSWSLSFCSLALTLFGPVVTDQKTNLSLVPVYIVTKWFQYWSASFCQIRYSNIECCQVCLRQVLGIAAGAVSNGSQSFVRNSESSRKSWAELYSIEAELGHFENNSGRNLLIKTSLGLWYPESKLDSHG